MKIDVELPVDIYIDNIGAIYMAQNNTSGKGTRHVNMRFHYCREVNGTLIWTNFVKSADNEADLMTKNPTKAEHDCYALKLVASVPNTLHPQN